MLRRSIAWGLPWLGVAVFAWVAGCRSPDPRRAAKVAPPELTPTVVEYVDSDAFDGVFEAALVSQDPVVAVRTGRESADWGPRLNAWIAAWNRGGRGRARTARGQAPVPNVVIDADSIREFRLLVAGLFGRLEVAAEGGSSWYRNERERSRRVSLLRPYNLRFHKAEDGTIDLIFFHGEYAAQYRQFVQKLMQTESMPEEDWARTVECSECKGRRRDRLTGRAKE